MKHFITLFSILTLTLFVFMCSDNSTINTPHLSDFFPLSVGNYRVYDVTDTRYSPTQGTEEKHYQEQHLVTESFKEQTGTVHYVIRRYRRKKPNDSFTYIDTWSAYIKPTHVILREENIDYVVLSPPLVKGKQWNGNAYNTQGGEDTCGDIPHSCDIYRISQVGKPYQFRGNVLTETIDVVQNNNTDPIVRHDVRKEIYIKNIGLVYKKIHIINYCTIGSCVGKKQINNSISIEKSLYEYGNK